MDAVAIDGIYPDDPYQGGDFDGEIKLSLPKRILIYGVTGSGKTTVARQLGELTGLPWHEADYLTWDPGWVMVPDDVQRQRIAAICAQDEWILDTAYAKWMEFPLARVELILGLDYSRSRTFWQLLKRTVARSIDKKLVCNGNVETLKGMFSKDSILIWHFKSFARKRARMRKWKSSQSEFEVILFRCPLELEMWMANLVLNRARALRIEIESELEKRSANP